jgi:hypothetical protein
MTKLEEVARAIAHVSRPFVRRNKNGRHGCEHEVCRYGTAGEDEIVVIGGFAFDDHAQDYSEKYYRLHQARAAIAALREPSEAMIEASNREWDGRMSHRSSGAWRAMIVVLLAEAAPTEGRE